MTQSASQSNTAGRCIALYPGAFRPPHKAHHAVVQHLIAQPHVDEVVIIIANRCRMIPGTLYGLDAEVARKVWEIYIDGMDKVRIEIAPHNAVIHALEYFSKVRVEDSLLFCLGEADLEDGDDRFRTLADVSAQTGIHAKILPAPTGPLPIRATSLRAALIRGETQKEEFFGALPTHLTRSQQKLVWTICQQGMRKVGDIIKAKIPTLLANMNVDAIQNIYSTNTEKIDQVFCLECQNTQRLFLKYAGDTVGPEVLGQPLSPKPRRRLATERRVLQFLKHNLHHDIELPEIVHFDKPTWSLVITEVCPEGTSLESQLRKGHVDPATVKKSLQFLAALHTMRGPIPSFWGHHQRDRQHWECLLDLQTIGIPTEGWPNTIQKHLAILKDASLRSTEHGFRHLNFYPKNILIGSENIGGIDFEYCSNIGDPAYDLGTFLGHYVYWILIAAIDQSWQQAIQVALNGYRQIVGNLWKRMDSRVIGFTGTTLLNIQVRERRGCQRDVIDRVQQAGIILLSQGIQPQREPSKILSDTILRFSN